MRELRRPRVTWLLLVVLAAPSASAALAEADLVVRGPLSFEGPLDLRGEAAGLLLQGRGSEAFEGVRFTLQAGTLDVAHVRLEQVCIEAAAALVATEALAVTDRPLALSDVPLPLDPAPLLPAPARAAAAAAEAAAKPLDPVLEALPLGLPGLPVGAAQVGCVASGPGAVEERVTLVQAILEVRPLDPGYTIFWDGLGHVPAEEPSPGTAPQPPAPGEGHDPQSALATLHASEARTRVQERGEQVLLVARDDAASWARAPRAEIPEGVLSTRAPSGHGLVAGEGHAKLYRVEAVLRGLDAHDGSAFEKVYRTGEHRESGAGPAQKRVLEFLELDAAEASGSYRSPAPVRMLARALDGSLDGTLAIASAHGQVTADGVTHQLDGGRALLEGRLGLALEPLEASEDGKPAMALRAGGDVLQAQGPVPDEPLPGGLAGAAAAASAFALLAGALAWFWPALKLALAPLYTRIAPDAVLMHGARENIYRLIREEPGIHAHEVAARLGLGWGTTVYHLKLLERNSLVVSRHEGRYKRFFVTGDARLQHTGAVALLRNDTSKAIAGVVAERPGLIQKQVCEALGLSPSLASWHLQRLEQAGVVLAERVGRSVRYQPGPAWRELQQMGPLTAAVPAAAAGPAPQPSAP